MSLLMQALKKAERAKQNAIPEEELDKPSQEFDDVLELTPQPAAPAPAESAPLAKRELNLDLEPMSGLSLEPIGAEPAASLTPRPMPDPLPAPSDHREPGLTLDLAPDPAAPPAATHYIEDPSAATPAAARDAHGASAASSGTAASAATTSAGAGSVAWGAPAAASGASAGAGSAAWDAPAAASGASAGAGPAAWGAPAAAGSASAAKSAARSAAASGGSASAAARAAQAAATAAAAAPTAQASSGKSAKSDKPRGAARARAAAAAANTGEPSGIDPERLRMFGLIAVLVLLIGGFGFYYWRALSGPGAGAGLPPVPMPPPGATGATPAQVIAAGPKGAAAPTAPAATADSSEALLAPPVNQRTSAPSDLEARLAHTEQELAAAQQAIQAAATARQSQQLPALAAPDNGDIRVARVVQASPVSPVLDNAYQAFNSGDWAGAQQQYAAALQQDPNNHDALLGMAISLSRLNQKDKAAATYQRMLELWPNDATAAANLVALRQGDPAQNEARLKALLANNPDAGPVLFELGNLYAQQGRWPDAQATYFRAFSAAPDNPDYAYNLAIGLDRLNQPKLAITYYQRALALAQDKAVAFDRNVLRKRLHELTTSVAASR